jgi:glutathione reductase (NADPH)
VLLVEQARLGGTCVNAGCIPKKLLWYAARFGEELQDLGGYGWSLPGAPAFDWTALRRARDAEVERLNGAYARLLDRAGVTRRTGRATITDPHTVRVGEEVIEAKHIVVATGGHPLRPSPPWGRDAWTSDDIFVLDALPRRIVVLGARYVGCELATILNGLGVETSLVGRDDLPLPGFDDDVRGELAGALSARGIALHMSADVDDVLRQPDGSFLVRCTSGQQIATDAILCAWGRVPSTMDLGLAEVGVELGPTGGILVDDAFRTTVPSIFAIGDVLDRIELTPVALAEAGVVADRLFGGSDRVMDYTNIPTAVFTSPPVATVGMTEAEARARGPVRIFRTRFRPLVHALTGRDERTLMKVVVDATSDAVLGIHLVGGDAPEIVQGFAVAIRCGVTKAQLDRTIGIHPTAAEELLTLRGES